MLSLLYRLIKTHLERAEFQSGGFLAATSGEMLASCNNVANCYCEEMLGNVMACLITSVLSSFKYAATFSFDYTRCPRKKVFIIEAVRGGLGNIVCKV